MYHVMRKTQKLKVGQYGDLIININEYLAVFPGSKAREKIGETELN